MNENEDKSMGDLFPDLGQETPIISGVAHDSSESLATVRGVTASRAWRRACSPASRRSA